MLSGRTRPSPDHAIADWTQGDFGGRALFEQQRFGVPGFNVGSIADRLAKAETGLSPRQLARMKRFVGTAPDHKNTRKTLETK